MMKESEEESGLANYLARNKQESANESTGKYVNRRLEGTAFSRIRPVAI